MAPSSSLEVPCNKETPTRYKGRVSLVELANPNTRKLNLVVPGPVIFWGFPGEARTSAECCAASIDALAYHYQ
jgi:hypothetical protein